MFHSTWKLPKQFLFYTIITLPLQHFHILINLYFSFPKESGEHFLNLGIRSRFLALQPKTALIFAVEQLSFILEKEKVKTIIKIEFNEVDIIPRLQEISNLQDRVMFKLNAISVFLCIYRLGLIQLYPFKVRAA